MLQLDALAQFAETIKTTNKLRVSVTVASFEEPRQFNIDSDNALIIQTQLVTIKQRFIWLHKYTIISLRKECYGSLNLRQVFCVSRINTNTLTFSLSSFGNFKTTIYMASQLLESLSVESYDSLP